MLRLQRAIGNRATTRLLQRVNGEGDEDEGGVATVVTKQKRSRNQRRKAKAAAAAAPAPAPAAAEPEKPAVPTAEIRIEGLPRGTLAGTTLRSDGRDVATVSAEQLSNTAGARGEDHAVPLDILADAARRAKSRWKSWKADETAGGNYAYYFPVGSDTKTNRWLCVVYNTGGVLLTSYVLSRSEVARKTGRTGSDVFFDTWAQDKHLYPSWR